MIRRIYLDLDDVCNTLSMYFLTLVGCKVSPTDYGDLPAGSVFDLADIANRLLGERRFTRPSFWQSFTRDDWASVPETPEFPWLLEQCERLVGRENIIIATSPTKDPDCAAGGSVDSDALPAVDAPAVCHHASQMAPRTPRRPAGGR